MRLMQINNANNTRGIKLPITLFKSVIAAIAAGTDSSTRGSLKLSHYVDLSSSTLYIAPPKSYHLSSELLTPNRYNLHSSPR